MASTGIRRRHADKHNSICTSLEVDWYWSSQFPILLYFSTVFSFDDRFQSFFIYPFTHVPYVDSSVFRLSVLSSVFVKGLLLCTLSSWGRRRTWLCTASHMQKIVYFLYHINSCSTKQLHKLVRQVIHPVYLFLLTSIYPHTVKFSKPFFFIYEQYISVVSFGCCVCHFSFHFLWDLVAYRHVLFMEFSESFWRSYFCCGTSLRHLWGDCLVFASIKEERYYTKLKYSFLCL